MLDMTPSAVQYSMGVHLRAAAQPDGTSPRMEERDEVMAIEKIISNIPTREGIW